MYDWIGWSRRNGDGLIRRVRLGTITVQCDEHVVEELFLLLPSIGGRRFRHDDVDCSRQRPHRWPDDASCMIQFNQISPAEVDSVLDPQFPGCFGYATETNTLRSEWQVKNIEALSKKQTEPNENKTSGKYQQDNAPAAVSLLFQGNIDHAISQCNWDFNELYTNIARKWKPQFQRASHQKVLLRLPSTLSNLQSRVTNLKINKWRLIFDPVQNPDDYPKDEIKHSLICQLDFWITSLKRVRFHLKHLEKWINNNNFKKMNKKQNI